MIHYNVFMDGKKKAVTFSYDDGPSNDVRLIELFNKYGVKGSFHLNGKKYLKLDADGLQKIADTYAGHEISCHTLNHGWPTLMPDISVVNEIVEDRKILEKIAGYPVIGMSYPFGDYDAKRIEILRNCGIVYSRTVKATNGFGIPRDFMEWHPTCHHTGALALCENYLDDPRLRKQLFYIWGHSYEFDTEEKWEYMEKVVSTLAGREDIWYATNIEIYNYVMAQRSLIVSVDEKTFTNNSSIDVWVERSANDIGEILYIPAGKTVTL
jgi:hypothetical protein